MLPRPRRGRILAAVGLLAVVAGALQVWDHAPPPDDAVHGFSVRPPAAVSAGQPQRAGLQETAGLAPFRPVRIAIPSLHLSVSLVPEAAPGGVLTIPGDFMTTWGWWSGGARPGDRSGPILLAGHKDHYGIGEGPADRLQYLRPRALAVVYGRRGQRQVYEATTLTSVLKTQFPTFARAALAPGGPNRLVIVTCGGAFDLWTGHYLSNVIVELRPLPSG